VHDFLFGHHYIIEKFPIELTYTPKSKEICFKEVRFFRAGIILRIPPSIISLLNNCSKWIRLPPLLPFHWQFLRFSLWFETQNNLFEGLLIEFSIDLRCFVSILNYSSDSNLQNLPWLLLIWWDWRFWEFTWTTGLPNLGSKEGC